MMTTSTTRTTTQTKSRAGTQQRTPLIAPQMQPAKNAAPLQGSKPARPHAPGTSRQAAAEDANVQRRREPPRKAQPTTFGIHHKVEADLSVMERAAARPRATLPTQGEMYHAGIALPRRSYVPVYHGAGGSSFGGMPQAQSWQNGLALLLVLAAVVLVWWLTATPPQTIISSWADGAQQAVEVQAAPVAQPLPALATPPGEHSLVTAPSVTAAQIDRVLTEFNSPAAGTGAIWISLGEQYQLDPAYALAFFIHESSAGTNPNWAGLKGGGQTTHNVGNIICAGYATCYGRFRDYPDWQTGIADWYRLIRDEYVQGRGTHTLEQIIPIYAPSVENNVPAYVQAVTNLIDSWKH